MDFSLKLFCLEILLAEFGLVSLLVFAAQCLTANLCSRATCDACDSPRVPSPAHPVCQAETTASQICVAVYMKRKDIYRCVPVPGLHIQLPGSVTTPISIGHIDSRPDFGPPKAAHKDLVEIEQSCMHLGTSAESAINVDSDIHTAGEAKMADGESEDCPESFDDFLQRFWRERFTSDESVLSLLINFRGTAGGSRIASPGMPTSSSSSRYTHRDDDHIFNSSGQVGTAASSPRAHDLGTEDVTAEQGSTLSSLSKLILVLLRSKSSHQESADMTREDEADNTISATRAGSRTDSLLLQHSTPVSTAAETSGLVQNSRHLEAPPTAAAAAAIEEEHSKKSDADYEITIEAATSLGATFADSHGVESFLNPSFRVNFGSVPMTNTKRAADVMLGNRGMGFRGGAAIGWAGENFVTEQTIF